MGVDSFLWLLKLWDRLCKEYSKQPRPLSNNQASGKRVQAILAATVKEKGCKGISGKPEATSPTSRGRVLGLAVSCIAGQVAETYVA